MIDKADALFLHAKKRLAMRYGEDLTREMHDKIIACLKSRLGPGYKISCRKYLAVVQKGKKGKTYYLLWDRKREQIITFLTHEMFCKSMGCK